MVRQLQAHSGTVGFVTGEWQEGKSRDTPCPIAVLIRIFPLGKRIVQKP